MNYEPKNFDRLLGIDGFSEQSLKNHFTLYQGYVANANKLADILASFIKESPTLAEGEVGAPTTKRVGRKTGAPEYAELKRRFGWEFNGMKLHEYYFGNMVKGGKMPDKNSELFQKISEDFGNYENWEKDFKSVGAMRGIGWAMLYCDKESGRLFNAWINEHDTGHLAGAVPLLVMDVFEHAYMLDYGLKRTDYVEAFFKSVYWEIVIERFSHK